MKYETQNTEVGRRYATAYLAHYDTKDLRKALELYEDIIAGDPESPEAEYSREQIQNIVKRLVPKQKLLTSNTELAREQLALVGPPRPRWVH